MLRNVAVVVVNGFLPFEFGTICEVFGVDRADDGLPSYDFAVVAGEPPPLRAHNDFTIQPSFGLERLNELAFYDRTESEDVAGFRRILVTEPGHPYLSAWWPPGHVLGWEHTFTHEVRDLVIAIAAGTDPAPSFRDGLQVQRVLAAVEQSAANGSSWTPVPTN